MKQVLTVICLAFFVSVPTWLTDPYLLNALITTGIFIIGALSLNLLLGFTGQLSLGHIAFFGIGAYVSALTSLGFDVPIYGDFHMVHVPWPPIAGFVLAIIIAGFCGYLVGRLSFRVRGAYFVIVTISFAEVVRLVALNWVDLTQGPLALTNIPSITIGLPGLGYLVLKTKFHNYYLVLAVATMSYFLISRLVQLALRARHARLDGERNAGGCRRHRRYEDADAGSCDLRGDRRRGRQSLCALHPHHRSRRLRLHLDGDDGDHGGVGRKGLAGRPRGRGRHLRPAAGVPAADHAA